MTGLRKRLFFTCLRDWVGSADGWNRGGREAQVGCRFVGPDGPRDGSRARVMRDGSRLNAVRLLLFEREAAGLARISTTSNAVLVITLPALSHYWTFGAAKRTTARQTLALLSKDRFQKCGNH